MSTGGGLEVISCLSELKTDAIGGRLKKGGPFEGEISTSKYFQCWQFGADSFLDVKRLPMRQVHQLDSNDLAHDEV